MTYASRLTGRGGPQPCNQNQGAVWVGTFQVEAAGMWLFLVMILGEPLNVAQVLLFARVSASASGKAAPGCGLPFKKYQESCIPNI